MNIIKIYKEHMPPLRLIGKRYTDADRAPNGSFSNKWGEWFANGWFDEIEKLGALKENDDAYLGVMRCVNNDFEYWIGMFFPQNTPVPEGFSSVDIQAGELATCWLYGREDTGELYGFDAHNQSLEKIQEQGWQIDYNPWYIERYNCPRFTTPDENGKVILDYCIYLKG